MQKSETGLFIIWITCPDTDSILIPGVNEVFDTEQW